MIEAEPGRIVLGGFKVQEEHCNMMGTLHGGVSASLVDIVRDACDAHNIFGYLDHPFPYPSAKRKISSQISGTLLIQ